VGDPVGTDFQLVPDAVQYVVEYTRSDLGTYEKTYAASDVRSDFNVDSQGNFISTPIWYFVDTEPAYVGVGSYRMRVITSTCESDWSPAAQFDNTESAACFQNGYCAEFICRYVAPPL
jgi:hypothetical protein